MSSGDGFSNVTSISINPKAMVASAGEYYPSSYNPTIPDSWETVAHAEPRGVTVHSRAHVVYTPVDNGDGSVTVTYQAFDENGNDITDQFNTLTLGETFIHKELN